ncbi:MAG: DNA helicase RecQ [Rhodospirillales bacterium]|nr:DNA helicase RecQ [Rhodospirillales bacterium]
MAEPESPPPWPRDKHAVLHETFGFEAFRPGQEPVVDRLIAGGHSLVIMPTGAGKSLCFQVPALVRGGLTVVVSPLVALMQNQVAALRLAGVAADTINASRHREDNVAVWRDVAAGRVNLLYLSPERLMTGRMLAALAKLPLSMIVIDEAHCISQWGHSFRPEYEQLTGLKDVFPGVPLAAFTATADTVTREDIARRLFPDDARTFVAGFDRPNIRLAVAPKVNVRKQLLDFVAGREGRCGIVYCLSRKRTEEMAATLAEAGHKALAYHAGLGSCARKQLLDRFLTEPDIVMTATIAFGMGIDKPDVSYVVHVDLPATVEAYYQEIGRAGRDGKAADAAMFFGIEDIRMRRHFIEDSDASEDRKRVDHRRLDALVAFCESSECRRVALLRYFGEEGEACGNCDVCLDPPTVIDGTDAARQAVEAVIRTGERFGVAHIVDVLTGKATGKVVQFRHETLAVYGAGSDRKGPVWRSIIRQLVAAHVLEVDVGGYGGLRATRRGRSILDGGETIALRQETLAKARSVRKARSAVEREIAVADPGLLQALKDLRLALAKERGVPPYVIFHDATLIELAAAKPADRKAFAGIHGVGASKLERFADGFLAVIARHG